MSINPTELSMSMIRPTMAVHVKIITVYFDKAHLTAVVDKAHKTINVDKVYITVDVDKAHRNIEVEKAVDKSHSTVLSKSIDPTELSLSVRLTEPTCPSFFAFRGSLGTIWHQFKIVLGVQGKSN